MKEYTCYTCGKKFKRYQSSVRNELKVFCSRTCVNIHLKTAYLGANNPRYTNGDYCDTICICGNNKDTRATRCSICSKKGYPKNSINSEGSIEIVSNELLTTVVGKSHSYLEIANELKVSRRWVVKRVKKLNIDISHFKRCNNRPYLKEDVIVKNSKVTYGTLRKFVIQQNLIEYICCECGQSDTWNNKKLVLELHHINGNNRDNRINNLVFLCPNCHSQTISYKGRKI